MTETLKPCPFCGSTPTLCRNNENDSYYVHCTSCNAISYEGQSKTAAIYGWEYHVHRVNEKLKKCSLCGANAREIFTHLGFAVDCSRCGNATILMSSLEEAINDWNSRSDSKRKGVWRKYDDEANAWECLLCHEVWQLNEGTPEENHMSFCSRCGAAMTMETET